MISYNWELSDWMLIILQIWENVYVITLQVLTKEKQSTRRVYQDYITGAWRPPTPNLHILALKGNSKFKSYL